MDKLGLYLKNLDIKLVHPQFGFFADITRHRRQAYTTWDPYRQTFFTTSELHRLNRRFGHPSIQPDQFSPLRKLRS